MSGEEFINILAYIPKIFFAAILIAVIVGIIQRIIEWYQDRKWKKEKKARQNQNPAVISPMDHYGAMPVQVRTPTKPDFGYDEDEEQ